MIIMAVIITASGDYYQPRMCAQINYTLGENRTLLDYPDCQVFYTEEDLGKQVLVHADMKGSAMTAGAALGLSFGPALWLALALHAAGIEIYVR